MDSIDGEDFYEIYRRYGYDQALSRDSSSLSYVYALDEKNWLLMLDSCQYEPENKVEGRIKESTLAWMDEQLLKAREQGIFVLPIAHHNLLAQSRMYTTQCAMDNNSEVIDLLQKYRLPCFSAATFTYRGCASTRLSREWMMGLMGYRKSLQMH